MIKKEKCRKKKVKSKKNWKKRNECFGADFFVRKYGGKGLLRNLKNNSKMKRIISHTLFSKKKKTREQKKKEKWQEEKKQKMSSPICWMKNNILSDTSQQASKKCENWRNHFSRHRNIRQNKKNKCKTCPTNKGNRQNLVFFVTQQKEKV